jgi:hypothetical protein
MLRITPDVSGNNTNPAYTNPADNPFVGVAGADEIYAVGLRNPWRWSFDRGGTNQLWAGDVGQDAIEEIDIITRSGNYGWRVYEGTSCTGLGPASCTPANYTMPVTQYSQTAARCSVTGGYVYRGTQGTLPNGIYIYADYCSGELFTWDGLSQVLRIDTPRLVSSFGEDEDGELYITGLGTGTVDKIVRAKSSADLDGDFRTDIGVFRPSSNDWFWLESGNASNLRHYGFGSAGDIPTPEDFDGDNRTDVAVFRPSNGTWYAVRSSNNTVITIPWGTNNDIPVQGDYDGDAKADFGVFRPSDGTWYIVQSTNSQFKIIPFGLNGDKPVQGDYDGDGKYDIAVYRGGNWYSLQSTNNAFVAIPFGLATDIPATGDFDNDSRLDRAVYRNGTWYQLRSNLGFQAIPFGLAGDIPSVGDYDGDNIDDIAVWRPSNGTWYALRSTGGFFGVPFGSNGDVPIPASDMP